MNHKSGRDPKANSAELADAAARERILKSLDESLVVEAAAGTGKTTALVGRLVAVLRTGRAEIGGIVAVTFTRKAAGQLSLRLRMELDRAAASASDPEERRRLTEAIAHLEEAHIGTIHSFCAELLRERPVEARIDPAFEEMDEEEAVRLYERAFRRWIEQRLEDPPPGVRRALSRLAVDAGSRNGTPLDLLRQAGWALAGWRDFPARWRQEPWDREEEIDGLVQQVAALAAMRRRCENRWDNLRRDLRHTATLDTWIRRSESVTERRDYDGLEARLRRLYWDQKKDRTGRGEWFVEGELSREDVVDARDALLLALEGFRMRADADLAALLQRELTEVLAAYEDLKASTGQLDFQDLLLRARDLVCGHREVRAQFRERFTKIFVDEFHDTDPLQAEILLLLSGRDPETDDWRRTDPVPGKLFIVADPKQSIYRFRRADVVLYHQIRGILVKRGVELVHLTTSFRSTPAVQEAVNAAFDPEMTGDHEAGQPEYVPLDRYRLPIGCQPAVVALPIPDPYSSYGNVTQTKLNEGQPDVIAAFVAWLLQDSGWLVSDPEQPENLVPIKPQHISILFRRMVARWWGDLTRPYLASLDAREIPHASGGGRSFHRREEVEILRVALTAIEWPDDELSVFAVLKQSLFALPDDLLLRYRTEVGALNPLLAVHEVSESLEPVVEALSLLRKLHLRRNRVPVVATINELLRFTRAQAGFALRPAGDQILANVQRVADLARCYELRNGISFRGFVERLAEASEQETSAKSQVPEDAEGVRLMTVHDAKGLEFPVVVLADMTAPVATGEPSRHVDPERKISAIRILECAPWELVDNTELERRRDQAEGLRIAYVAATRARDLLVVPAVGDAPYKQKWLSVLNKAVYPDSGHFRDAETVPACPEFGETSVFRRSPTPAGEEDKSVRPGLHHSAPGNVPVVWWDPATLELGLTPNFGVRQEHILAEPSVADCKRSSDWLAYQEWRDRQDRARERGSEPTIRCGGS